VNDTKSDQDPTISVGKKFESKHFSLGTFECRVQHVCLSWWLCAEERI